MNLKPRVSIYCDLDINVSGEKDWFYALFAQSTMIFKGLKSTTSLYFYRGFYRLVNTC